LELERGEEMRSIREDDQVPEEILRHRIYRIQELLIAWPDPYVKALGSEPFEEGLRRVLYDVSRSKKYVSGIHPIGQLRSDKRNVSKMVSSGTFRFKPHEEWQEGLLSYGFEIDFSFTEGRLVSEFQKWLKDERARLQVRYGEIAAPDPRGGLPNDRNPAYWLKALAALRVWGDPADSEKRGRFKELTLKVKKHKENHPAAYKSKGDGGLLPVYNNQEDSFSQKSQEKFIESRKDGERYCKMLNSIVLRDRRPWKKLEQDWEKPIPGY